MESLREIWGEIYWNGADWLPWIGIQLLLCGVVGAIIQWWFKKGLVVFLILLTLVLPVAYRRLPAPVFSTQDLVRMNAGLPMAQDGVTLERISFAHRFLTYNLSIPEPMDDSFLAYLDELDPISGYCSDFGRWLSTRQIKRIIMIYSYSGGEEVRIITAGDCPPGLSVQSEQTPTPDDDAVELANPLERPRGI